MVATRVAAAALLLALSGLCDASLLRRKAVLDPKSVKPKQSIDFKAFEAGVNKSVAETKEKFKKLDEVMSTMFKLACSWKHGHDIDGLTLEKLQDRTVKPEDTLTYKKKLQDANVRAMEEGCAASKLDGETKCRKSCLERPTVKDKDDCDKACVGQYAKFAAGCSEKVKHLAKVYESKLTAMNTSQQCQMQHCKEFPTVWMKANATAMQAEVTAQCTARCADDKVEKKCTEKWGLKLDGLLAGFKAQCYEKAGVKACFDKKKAEVNLKADSCRKDGAAKCQADQDGCLAKLGADQKDVCQSRRRTCDGELSKTCQDALTKGLELASSSCDAEGAKATDKCVQETTVLKQKEDVAHCKQEQKTRCPQECGLACNSGSLFACLSEKAKQPDLSEEFCTELWKMVRDTSVVDPSTGNPIALLTGNRKSWGEIFAESEEPQPAKPRS